MNYLITESQMQLIVERSVKERLTENMKELSKIADKILEDVLLNYKLNFKFLMTWGAALGGMMGPMKQWIEGNIPDITPQQVSLLTLGVVSQYFYDNPRKINALMKKIKDLRLANKFKLAKLKANELMSSFSVFLISMGLVASNTLNIMSYGFLIPILEDLYLLLSGADNLQSTILMIGRRITASGVVLITGSTLSSLMRKLAKKF